MSDKLCINYNTFTFMMVIIILCVYLFYTNSKSLVTKPINESNSETQTINIPKNVVQEEPTQQEESSEVLVSSKYLNPKSYKPLVDKLIDQRDEDANSDPLTAPTRRLPRHIYPTRKSDFIEEVPTRGYPDSYHYYGVLRRESDNKFVKLFGRQIYPGSSQYEYYIETVESDLAVKIPLEINNGREIFDGDEIDIEVLDSSKGKFRLYMNKYDRPRYNPFVIN